MLHRREESEIAEDLHEVGEPDESAGLGEREVQRVEHGPDTEGQEQYHVAAREHVADERLGAVPALPASGSPPLPPL